MRTTLTLDDDVAAKLRSEMRKSGKSFKRTVNEFLRVGLNARREMQVGKPFKVRARPAGPRPGINFDCVSRLIHELDTGWRP